MSEHDPRFPIGDFTAPATITTEDRRYAIETLAALPENLREAVRGLEEAQLDTPYRDGGWTVRRLVHHIGDSHMTAFHRTRKALTEDWPEVAGYDQAAFADLPDSAAPVEWSLDLIEGLHARWVLLLEKLSDKQWQRGFRHSERGREALDLVALQYAWHSLHHTAHITSLRSRNGW